MDKVYIITERHNPDTLAFNKCFGTMDIAQKYLKDNGHDEDDYFIKPLYLSE